MSRPSIGKATAFVLTVLFYTLAGSALAGDYEMTIDEVQVNFTGKDADALAIDGSIPAPLLRFTEGEDVTIRVTNNLSEVSSVHWHGLLVPPEMDGVPGISFDGIPPGETFTYRFRLRQNGTYWYHSHSGFQEQEGIYGPMIVDPVTPDPVQFDREHVIMLSDWKDEDPETVHANLKSMSDYYNYAQRTVFDFFDDISKSGFDETLEDRLNWGEMRMTPTDISDVSGYTFLLNGQTTAAPWTGKFVPGERVRLRFINGAAMSYFDVRIPGLEMQIVQTDGQNVVPVTVDEFRIAVAETYDVIVTPKEAVDYQILAEAMDRTGFAAGMLMQGTRTAVLTLPPSRPRSLLTMSDMAMDHGMSPEVAPHRSQQMHSAPDTTEHASTGHTMPITPAMDHAAMGHGSNAPSNDLLSPPVGAPEGAKVLSYADLIALEPNVDLRTPEREIIVRLGGNMERYIWTINDQKFEDASPIQLRYGERVKLTFINETMMNHPMHLHGMFVELENGQPAETQPRKHVVNVGPGRTYSVDINATEVGEWAFHCHLMYHMASGMFRKVVVARLAAEAMQ